MKISTIRKALLAAATAALAAGITAAPDGLTEAEVGVIVGAAVAAGFGVWKIRNAPTPPS